jgi:hypothetical protein
MPAVGAFPPPLVAVKLDATFVIGEWTGEGSEILNEAIGRGWFKYPYRARFLRLRGAAVIHIGNLRLHAPRTLPFDEERARREVEFRWPEAHRQKLIPTVTPFAIKAKPGDHIMGEILAPEEP